MNYPAVMEERNSKRDLVHERFDLLLDDGRLVVEHGLKMGPGNLQNQHVVFPVHALHLEMIQKGKDTFRSGMRP